MLEAGEIDALISARNPSCFGRNPKVVRLFRQHVAVEQDYYRRTGVHPIMHTVGVRTALLRKHPWLAASLTKAFEAARKICLAEIDGTGGAAMATLAVDDRLRRRDKKPHGAGLLALRVYAQ